MKKAVKASVIAAAAFAFGCAAVACSDGADPGKKNPTEPDKYIVTYEKGEGAKGTAPTGGEYAAGEKFCLEAETGLSNDGHTFGGWLCSADNVTYDAGVEFEMPAYAVTFTAQWNENTPTTSKYAVKYVLGTGVSGIAPTGGEYEAGATVTVESGIGLKKEGWKFIGWNNGTVTYTVGQTFSMPSREVTLTSDWVKDNPGVTYSVTVIKSHNDSLTSSVVGEIPTIANQAAGDTFTIPADTFSLAHYHQIKWRVQHYDSKVGYWATDANYNPDEEIVMPAHSVRIAAVWEANTVTISFDANGGSGAMADNTSKQYNQTLSLPNCTFTAPSGKEFKGWATSPNGSPIDNGTKLDETIVKPNDTLTLYAVWDEKPSTALDISEIAGHWTDATGAHTFDVSTETFGNKYAQGGGILDGKYAVYIVLSEEGNAIADIENEGAVYYELDYADSKLTLATEDGDEIVFTDKTALTASSASEFVGNWAKPLTSGSQPWVITADKAYYNASLAEAKTAIVGSHIAISYDFADHTYVYVLSKNGDKLEGYYIAPELDPAAVEFNAGEFYTLTVNGTLNQIVNSGAAVDTSKLPTSDNDGAITGWVVEGTSTAFDPATATITSNTSITAVHGGSSVTAGTTYEGSGTDEFSQIKVITINFDTNEITFNNDSSTKITVAPQTTAVPLPDKTTEERTGYRIARDQCKYIDDLMWIILSDDGTSLELWYGYNPQFHQGTLTFKA